MNMGLIKRFLILLILPLFLISCGSKEPEWKPKRARPRVKPPVQAAQVKAADKKKEMVFGKIHRNPFLSYLLISKKKRKISKIRGPLECCDITLFGVVAVVVSEEKSFALVQAPDNKRYIVRRGDLVGDMGGRVIRVDSKGITVREYKRDDRGKVSSSKDIRMDLPSKEEGANLRR